MKTIHCEVYIRDLHNYSKKDVIAPVTKPMPDKMSEEEAARFILSQAAEQLPRKD